MYTKEHLEAREWQILDPTGEFICIVIGEYSANALLTHLNRG